MKILIACEESQSVTKEFRARGHDAFSCDIEPCSGGHPGWHMQGDVIPFLKEKWDMIIAFPPCTALAVSGARWFKEKQKDGRQEMAINFFMTFAMASCEKIAIENPISIMSTAWRKPDQIIQPWYFGDPFFKSTCIWLKNLPSLKDTDRLIPPEKGTEEHKKWSKIHMESPGPNRSKNRSKTFPGIAKAMAEQWG